MLLVNHKRSNSEIEAADCREELVANLWLRREEMELRVVIIAELFSEFVDRLGNEEWVFNKNKGDDEVATRFLVEFEAGIS